jgi:mono/diheme cytochrome c family protein
MHGSCRPSTMHDRHDVTRASHSARMRTHSPAVDRGAGRLRTSARAAAIALAALLVTGCGGEAERSSSDNGTAGIGPAPTGQLADGDALYQANCASCHGADLRGTSKGPSHLSVVYEPNHHGDDAFRSAIANGSAQHHWEFGDMPPVEGLSSSEVEAIIAYVRDVQEREGFE